VTDCPGLQHSAAISSDRAHRQLNTVDGVQQAGGLQSELTSAATKLVALIVGSAPPPALFPLVS